MITCPTCGSRLPDDTEICSSCGQYPRGICAYCGTARLLSAPTCPTCNHGWLVPSLDAVSEPPSSNPGPRRQRGAHRRP